MAKGMIDVSIQRSIPSRSVRSVAPERDYEFKNYCNGTELSASGDVRVLLHGPWPPKKPNLLDLGDTVADRTPGKPYVYPKDVLDQLKGSAIGLKTCRK